MIPNNTAKLIINTVFSIILSFSEYSVSSILNVYFKDSVSISIEVLGSSILIDIYFVL